VTITYQKTNFNGSLYLGWFSDWCQSSFSDC